MGDQDLKNMVDSLIAAIQALQATAEANSRAIIALSESRSSASGTRASTGEHHSDRPPRFQKLDFPQYDGKADPLIFINRCKSYFHQQRIMEEGFGWCHITSRARHNYGTCKAKQTRAPNHGATSKSYSTCATGHPCDRANSRTTAAPTSLRNTRTGFRLPRAGALTEEQQP
ncbi:hypothetical protein GUJ93_ZPchr0014g46866 [Zizania palustris]|uniref:Uncharacterized protein n=1 Tax=Zizania palustris TaxID=103762 RepID=A0A8J5TGQ2_ZIZPA|nr:hypothetical protein GUJ93_ZPchr0014g46866 [Zizania palustris]